ncbi:unnamed protein product [Linum tenue]|uniref:Cytochrome P450 n=2 Tax=Linum tenue TaxID=586396 RepID=A0AAV0S5G5_9ROSI|nr:unnamed protein product [Linum tenue]
MEQYYHTNLYLNLLLLFISAVSLSFFAIFYKHKSQYYNHPNLPPGRPGIPYLGETLAFLTTGWIGRPEKFVTDRIREFSSSAFKTHIIGKPTVVLTGAEGNKFLFTNENKLVVVWWPDSVSKIFPFSETTSIHEESRRFRKFLPQFMKPEALQRYVGEMDEVARRHFASLWEDRDEVEVLPLTKKYTFWVACRLFVSLDDPARIAELGVPFDHVASGIFALPYDFPGTPFRRAIRASKFIREEYLMEIIRRRKAELAAAAEECDRNKMKAHQDILSYMLTATDDGGEHMSDIDIADKILGLLVGSHDTASATCTFVVKFLSELPDVYDRVYQEQMEIARSKSAGELLNWEDIKKMKYSWNVACEVLRLTPPVQGSFRKATTDFIFNGFSIPKGWKLYWSVPSTHKNEKYFPKPEKFDPSRFEGSGPEPYTFVPFGGGPKMCPGKEYARLEILVFMHNLVKRFKFEMLIPGEKIIVNPICVPANGLPIRLFPHEA